MKELERIARQTRGVPCINGHQAVLCLRTQPGLPIKQGRFGRVRRFSHKPWELVELLRSRGGLVSAVTGGVGVENGTRYDWRNAPTAWR